MYSVNKLACRGMPAHPAEVRGRKGMYTTEIDAPRHFVTLSKTDASQFNNEERNNV